MSKKYRFLILIFTFFIVFSIGIQKVYAAGEHKFSFRAYNCVEWDEEEEECKGPNNDYVAPEINLSTGSVQAGDLIKLAVYYEPGTDTFWNMSVFFFYDPDIVEPVHGDSGLKLVQGGTTYAGGPYYPLGSGKLTKYQTSWIVQYNDAQAEHCIATIIKDNAGSVDARHYLDTPGELYYIFLRVKDGVTASDSVDLTFDTNPGKTKIANNAPVLVTDASIPIYVEQSTDNTLGTLTVSNGSTNYPLTPTFVSGDKTNKTFSTVVPNNISTVNINAIEHDIGKAVLTGDTGNQSLDVGNNSFEISVVSESGDPELYTVNVYKLSNNANLSALGLTNVDFGEFKSGTTSYTATVPYTTSSTTVSATVADTGKATLASGSTGNKTLSVGSNPINVTVNAENCKSQYSTVPGNTCTSKTYTVTVTREEPSTISTLNDLLANNTRVKGFQPGDGTKTYTLDDVPYNTQTLNITYVKGESHETVTGDGSKTLSVGNNTFNVVVTAQDGTTKTTYTIKVKKLSNNANLSGLTVSSSKTGSLSPGFNANTTSYTYNTDADETSVNISYTLAHAGATAVTTPANLTGINPRTTSSVTIEVTPEDKNQTKKTYTITFAVAKSTNGDLSGITIDGEDLEGFQSGTKDYSITVPKDTESIVVGATLADDRAEITGGTGIQTLDYGENTIEITVQPEDPNAEPVTYTLTVTREKEIISTLNDLLVDNTRVKGFTPGDESNTYELDAVGYSKANINITYVKGESHETITGDGTKTLNVGMNTFPVVVTSHDGQHQTTYTIKIYKKNNNANLSGLNVTSSKTGNLDPNFASNKTNYTYNTDADETSVNITYTKADENASVVTTPANLTGINPRNTQSVTIQVTPEDTTQAKKTYTITFAVAKSTNGDLSGITIDGEDLDGFQSGTRDYSITVPNDTESIVVGASLADDRAEITGGTGLQTLDYGENTIEITVQPEDPNAEPVTYTLTVTRSYKTDANLTDLKADNVTVPNFHAGDPDGTEYNVGSVASTKATINIAATLSDPAPNGATVTGTGDIALSVGDNRLPVVVTAHDGTTKKTYYVLVKRLNSAKNLETLTITSDPAGTLDPDFDPEKTTYTYTTDPNETEVTINATVPEGSGSTILSGPGTYNPETTSEVTIVVKAEDGSEKPYVISLVRGLSRENTLNNLGVTGYELNEEFKPGDTEYTVTIPHNVDSITITTEKADSREQVTGDGLKENLTYGENQYNITVTAEDPTVEPKVYTLTVTRSYKTDANLLDLKVDGVTVPNFHANDPDGTTYDLGKVNSDKEQIEITATLSDPSPNGATITGVGIKTLQQGDNTFPVEVTAHDGTTKKTYYIKVRQKLTDNTLTGIDIIADTEGTLSPEFDPTKTEYTYTSDPDEDSVTIVAHPAEGASAAGDGEFNPQVGEDATIVVTAEDGTINTYVIHVVRGKCTDATLDELGVIGYDLNEEFKPEDDHYTVTVPADVDKVIITAHAADAPRAQVEGTGEKTVDFGSNVFTVTVIADDTNVTKPYYVTVIRELSSNVKLSDLKVNDETVDGFDEDRPSYTYGPVSHDVTSLDVTATPKDSNATANVSGNDNLTVGENVITIEVVAQNGEKGYYTITVTREGNDDNTLSGLEVEGYTLDPEFDPTKDDDHFTVTVPSDVDSVVVNATPNDEDGATVTVEGADNLQPGENTITVTVTAENGDEKVYTITVTKEEEPEEDEKITSHIRIIADGMIKDVVYKTLPLGLKDECDNDNDLLFIYDSEDQNEIDNNQQLGTGMIIKLIKNNRENDRDIIVVKGEVTGDGEIRINDVVRAVSAYVGAEELTGPWFEACDIATDGEIRINDVVSIVNLYVGE
ncbi:MAG: cadherin-like beta sandwich domain-containing protein [Bacilli bacterium]|nr:cadherin-like beta sandwich domain-containing protein [Bacilli bacterium]